MEYFVVDTTQNGHPVLTFKDIRGIMGHLKVMMTRKFGMSYDTYLTHIADLGYFGYDERDFYESLKDTFRTGIVLGEKCVDCNILYAQNEHPDASD